TTTGFSKVKTLTATALLRSFAIRGLPKRGAPLQSLLSRYDERLAQGFAGVLTPDVTHVVVSQSLLPALWMGGHLGGRTFDVLMTRPPMVELEKELDRAHLLHPESWTLSDFRARSDLKRAEADALAEAGYLVTPHAEIAKRFGARAIRLDWRRPSSYTAVGFDQNRTAGRSVLFPESTLARKGAYELREAARALDLEIVLLGPVLEDPDFWGGVRVRQAGDNWLKGIDVVCLPSFVASSPRRLLNAVAQGVPVITTPACGLGYAEGVTTVMPGDAEALIGEIERVLEPGSGVLKSKILRLAKS
ncbi:MAG: glycosyltransferase, partial [Blastocatellia bacterium]